MENKPSIDREILIPILIGGLSIVGIVVVLLIGRAMNAPAEVAATPSATPFQYVYLGTEPAISTSFIEGSEVVPPDGTSDEFPGEAFPTDAAPDFGIPTRASASTPLVLPTLNVTSTTGVIILQTNTPNRQSAATATPRNVTGTAAAANTYDDSDSRLLYEPPGSWLGETSVDGAHQSTLHVSNTTGSTVTFTFTGQAIELFYQPGPSLGTITVTIDSLGGNPISQAQGGTWSSGPLSNGTHTVVIEHESGGSVNIDWLRVTPSLTPTPTSTATATPTQ
ncbi:MAG TPA: hypothetical protein VK897_28135 [Anaerolineales bacterium]|nr:hypothetical protein [Anaerolineales bacterium]